MVQLPSTVLTLPLRARLRAKGTINSRLELERMGSQAKVMLDAMCIGLIACSGRWPGAADASLQRAVTQSRQRLGLALDGHVSPHWLWQYLAGAVSAVVPHVRLEHCIAELMSTGWKVEVTDSGSKSRRLVAQREETTFEWRFASIVFCGQAVYVAPQDFRSTTKRAVFDTVAASYKTLDILGEIGAASSAAYYLGSWVAAPGIIAPPDKLAALLPECAQKLTADLRAGFAEAVAVGDDWRSFVAERESIEKDSQAAYKAIRSSSIAIAYEALKCATSWVSLDMMAADDRETRSVAVASAINDRVPASRRAAVHAAIAWLSSRAASQRSACNDAIVLDASSMDWRACQAVARALDNQEPSYRDGDQVRPWSHPDLDAFLSACVEHHDGLRDLLTAGVEFDPESPAPSIAELHRTALRARGRARMTLPSVCRIHVDRSSAGTNGMLATVNDVKGHKRRRWARHGVAGSNVLEGTVEWLGDVLRLKWYIGRNRSLVLTNDKSSWNVVFSRNARHTTDTMHGVLKSFDLVVSESKVVVTLPINVELTGYENLAFTKSLALGCYYIPRPGAGPVQPDAKKTVPAEMATVIGIDLGREPLAGWAVVRRNGDMYTTIKAGSWGDPNAPDCPVYDPGLMLSTAKRALELSADVRRELRRLHAEAKERAESPLKGTPNLRRRLGPAVLARRARLLAVTNGEILASIEASAPSSAWVNVFRSAYERLQSFICSDAARAVRIGTPLLVSRATVLGRGEQALPLSQVVTQAIDVAFHDVHDADIRRVARVLWEPVAQILLAAARSRSVRWDMGLDTLRTCKNEQAMNTARNIVAMRHGYASEAHVWSLLVFGRDANDRLHSPVPDEEGVALQRLLQTSDILETLLAHVSALLGWNSPPLARGDAPLPSDPRFAWRADWGYLSQRAAAQRKDAHRVLARRAVQMAVYYQVNALVIENLDIAAYGRKSADENTLSRRLAIRQWQAMIVRAADLAGVPLILADPLHSKRELIRRDERGAIVGRQLGIRIGSSIANIYGQSMHDMRVNAAENLAIRSLSGYQERARFRVLVGQSAVGRVAILAHGASGYAAWQKRMAQALGADSAAALAWVFDGDNATVAPRPDTLLDLKDAWLCAADTASGTRRWLLQSAYDAAVATALATRTPS